MSPMEQQTGISITPSLDKRSPKQWSGQVAAILPNPRTRRPQEMHRYGGIIERRMTQMGW